MKKTILLVVISFFTIFCKAQTVTATTDHSISLTAASAMTKAYRDANLNTNYSERFGKNAINDILSQDDCIGLIIYYAIDSDGKLKVVIAGLKTVSGQNKTMYTGKLADRGYCCGATNDCCLFTGDSNPLNTD